MENYSASPALRAAAYWFIDGLPEIVSGFVMVLCGGIGFALWKAGLNPLPGFLGFLVLWKDREIIEFFKARLTYPRTGYVRPPKSLEDHPPQTITTLMSPSGPASDKNVTHLLHYTVVPLALAALYTYFSGEWFFLTSVCGGAVVSLYVFNRKLERPYRWWEILLLALAGSALVLSNLPARLRPSAALTLSGAWLLLLGGGKLVLYLRTHPRPAQEGARA